MPSDDLLDFIESVSGDSHLAIEENLGDGYVRLKTAEAERRQARHDIRCIEDIVIEMLRNARDAGARNIYLATSREGEEKTLVFIDDGEGIPSEMHERIFEPRVTSKLETMVMDTWGVHGRGMALYSIRSNCRSAHVIASAPDQGSSFVVKVDLGILSEKSDQSSLPVLGHDDQGGVIVASGPHNIVRTVVEFALDVQDDVCVRIGSPAEIAAALVESGRRRLSDAQLLFTSDIERLPLVLRPALAADAVELAEICAQLGLDMSERTAHRVLAGQIDTARQPLVQLLDKLRSSRHATGEVDIYRDSRGLKIAAEDLSEFSHAISDAFLQLANRYYIESVDEPIIRVGKDAITIRIPFDKEL